MSKRMLLSQWTMWAFVWIWVWSSTGTARAATVYVSKAGNNANDGQSWATAKLTVQAGLNAAVSADQVWVAAGTYVERITLKSGVGLYGGFAGNETQLTQRNWATNTTILDGNASGSVVTPPPGATTSTRIDGFTIRNGSSGGISCSFTSPAISNNTITGNSATYGGGIYCDASSSPTITNNTITGNSANAGGGIYCYSSSPAISHNTIGANSASSSGGGIYCSNSSPAISNNTISANSASSSGGGIYCYSLFPAISNNTITGNSGSGISCSSSSPSISNNTITGNTVYGISCSSSSSAAISNNIVAFNSSGLYNTGGGTPLLRNNCVHNPANYTGLSAGAGDISVDPQLLAAGYGEVHLKAGSPCIDAGLDSVVQPGWLDMDGQARIQGVHVDIGADEFDGTTPAFTPKVVCVSPSGSDANDGSTWALAKLTVQAGIDAASGAGGGEVWVAAGTYNQRITLKLWSHVYGGFAGTESSRNQRDWVTNATILDGGAGGSVVTASAPGEGSSTIDGFTIRNGTGSLTDSSTRYGGGIYCYRSSPAISNNTITGNGANHSGGGIYCGPYSSPAISHNTITGNSATYGGGVNCDFSSSAISNNTITGNSASTGGGISCSNSSPAISNNTISGNSTGWRSGGGIYCSSSSPAISNNIVAFNSSGLFHTGGTPTLRNNCVYHPGGANYSGLSAGTGDISVDPQLLAAGYGEVHLKAGSPCIDAGLDSVVLGGWLDMDGQVRIQGVHVDIGADEFDGTTPAFTLKIAYVSPSGNDANDGSSWASAKLTVQAGIDAASGAGGGEVWVAAGTYNQRITLKLWSHVYGGFAGTESSRNQRDWVTNATILDGGAGGSVVTASVPGYGSSTIDGFTIRNGIGTLSFGSRDGGGIYCLKSSPAISHNTITGNSASFDGGGIYCGSSSPAISNNTITGNSASFSGGGICCSNSSPAISNNTISANSASSAGGGIYCTSSYPVISNNTILGNNASYGGGIYCDGSGSISNNTISGNSAGTGGGISCSSSSAAIANNIVAFNSSGLYRSGGSLTLRNNCVYNPGGANYTGLSAGTGDISMDPLFVNRPAGDYHLAAGSPCIDAAYNAAVPAGILKDLSGHPRFLDDPATPDCQWSPGNCGAAPIVDMGAYEFVPVFPGDFNRDGYVDSADLSVFAACATRPGIPYDPNQLPQPSPGCTLTPDSGSHIAADFDADGIVDMNDFGIQQRCYSGNQPANPNCAN